MDDKKKTMILGVLFVVIIGVGAFQLRPSGAAPAPQKTAAPVTTVASATKDQAAAPDPSLPPYPSRDPFDIPEGATATNNNGGPKPALTPAGETGVTPHEKQTLSSLPPMSLSGTQLSKDQPSGLIGAPSTGVNAAAKPEPTMGLRLVGVVSGEHPVAILADSTGNQRLIRVGSEIDPDTRLLSIERGSATVDFRGKTLRLFLTGDPNAK